ncbi:hypothetical protein CPY53_04115 [Paenibacillus polymyxa]|nr:hypothetical protein CPY53_04115 [Paenibacillus polymyxa]
MYAIITLIGGEVVIASGDGAQLLRRYITQDGQVPQVGWVTYGGTSINLQNALKIEFKEEA